MTPTRTGAPRGLAGGPRVGLPGRAFVVALALPAVAVATLAGLVGLAPAQAATHTVTLNGSGPSPKTVTIKGGDTVTFTNADSGNHTVTHNAGAWSFQATIRPGASATTPPFAAAGQYGYNDGFFIVLVQQNVSGSISVQGSTPSPTPKPSATKSPTRSPVPSPTRSRAPTPSASASPTPSGVAIRPGIGGLPSLPPGTTTGPTPNVAPPETSAPATPTTLAYGPKSEIVQTSVHRYGLPVLLALLAVVGMLSLLVRLLLAEPGPVRRTAESVEDGES